MLRGVGPSPGATGRVIWNQAAGGQLFAANLPSVPQGKAYVLWMIGAGSPRPAGVFRVDAEGRATHHVAPARSEEHTSELQSHSDLVCRLLLEKKKKKT